MKYASITIVLLSAVLLDVGCGSDRPAVPQDLAAPADLTTPPDLTKVCVSQCTMDDECADSCPAPASGIWCCDTSTNTCYRSTAQVCPPPAPDLGGMTMY